MIERAITHDSKLRIVTTKVLTHKWIKIDFAPYDEGFKHMRDKMTDKFNRCFACDWPFQVGKESISLACFNLGVGNKPLCRDCAVKLSNDAPMESQKEGEVIPKGAEYKKKFQLGVIYFKRTLIKHPTWGEMYEWEFFDNYQTKWVLCQEPRGAIKLNKVDK